jgi:serine/threonine-protein kinase CHEK2
MHDEHGSDIIALTAVTVDLIDSMLVVDPERRFTIDQCLSHPWITAGVPDVNDSTNGLVSGVAGLEVNRRAPHRERTLLSTINTIQVTNRVPMGENQPDLKIYSKNPKVKKTAGTKKEPGPADKRDPREFMEMGGKGDQELYGYDGGSVYSKNDVSEPAKSPAARANGEEKANGH